MQYLVSVIHDQAGLAAPDEMAAIDVFNERLQAEGHWVFAGGLASPGTATVIDNRRGGDGHRRALPGVQGVPRRLLDHRGPDLDVALKLAAEGSKACNRKIGSGRCAQDRA